MEANKMLKILLFILSFNVYGVEIIDIDETMPTPIIYVKFAENVSRCVIFQTETGVAFNTTPSLPNETLVEYIDRHWLETTDSAIIDRCNLLQAKYEEVWKVQRYRTKLTRPIYDTELFITGERKEIGRIPYGTLCGKEIKKYSSTAKTLSWRQVTPTGTSVCKLQE